MISSTTQEPARLCLADRLILQRSQRHGISHVVDKSKEEGKRTAAGSIVYEGTPLDILVKDRIDRITDLDNCL